MAIFRQTLAGNEQEPRMNLKLNSKLLITPCVELAFPARLMIGSKDRICANQTGVYPIYLFSGVT